MVFLKLIYADVDVTVDDAPPPSAVVPPSVVDATGAVFASGIIA